MCCGKLHEEERRWELVGDALCYQTGEVEGLEMLDLLHLDRIWHNDDELVGDLDLVGEMERNFASAESRF